MEKYDLYEKIRRNPETEIFRILQKKAKSDYDFDINQRDYENYREKYSEEVKNESKPEEIIVNLVKQ